jgi:hypothetical protein
MTPKKTPTLAQLRNLAKRKGCEIRRFKYRQGDESQPFTEQISAWIHGASGMPFVSGYLHEIPIRTVVFAALSALPDAPKGGSK